MTEYARPLTPTGASGLVHPPPWHFAGHVLHVAFSFDRRRAAPLLSLPRVEGELEEGPGAFVFAHWQVTGRGLDPVADLAQGQFHEAFAVLPCRIGGRPYAWCPFMWVDSTASVSRGWVQGLPKKHGVVRMSRPVEAGTHGPRLAPGRTLAATLSSADRLLAEAAVVVRAPAPAPPELFLRRVVNRRLFPAYATGGAAVDELVVSTLEGVEQADCWTGDAELAVRPAAHDELDLLGITATGDAMYFQYAETVTGGAVLEA